MARPLDPEHSFELLKDGVVKSIEDYFPNGEYKGKRQTLRLKSVAVEDKLGFGDFEKQQDVKEKDGTWAVPVKAEFELVDNNSGKVIDRKKMTVAELPKLTPRFSYIVDGKERQVDHQSLLKTGIFTRVADNGVLESRFNTKDPDQRQSMFKVTFDPQSYKYVMKVGNTYVPAYSVMKAMGVSDDDMEKTWGKQIFAGNSSTNVDKDLTKLYKSMHRKDPESPEAAAAGVRERFQSLSLDPEVTRMVTGGEHTSVTGQSMLDATRAVLEVNQGKREASGYDDLRFKSVQHTEDYIPTRIREARRSITAKLNNNLDRVDSIDRILQKKTFNKPIKDFFTTSSLSTLGDQTNPLAMITGHSKHTILGEHGISSAHQVTTDAKIIHPSSYGFFDPAHTPESDRTGIALQIPLGSWKQGNELVTRAMNVRTGKMETVSASKLAGSNLAFPDEFDLSGKKPKARKRLVTIADREGQTRKAKASEVDYVLPNHAQMFSATSNLIPFLQNNNGNRVGYGTQQAHQALALVDREAPMVQSAIGKASPKGDDTFEGVIGSLSGHRALVGGKVTKVTNNAIHIKSEDGTTYKHSLYDDYPLNNKKGVLNSTPLVKAGDTVAKGKPIADTSFTKGGELALGTNLQVGYVAADGYNFEDGVVISESAAKKLTSEHMYKKELRVHQNMHLGKKKHKAHAPTTYKKDQLEAIGDDGVIAIGTKVKPGDPLILAVTKNAVTSESEGLARVSKGLVKDWKDSSVKWEGNSEGTVTKIIRHGGKVKVHVKTNEPMEVGDKLVGRHGNKGIVTKILPDSEMPQYTDPVSGDKTNLQVMLNPLGVPGRINPGQILETSASLIARKTGKPYKVKNFDPDTPDYTEKIEKELKEHGLEPEHEIRDPKTNKSMGKIHLGHQFMMKLDQQVSKKMSARGAGYGNPYDANRAPTTGGGRLGGLGNYAMLAHGATHNLREMQTLKSSMNDEAWRAIQTGDSMPAPRTPYAYEKFKSLMQGMGININKEGNQLILEPLTDDKIEEMSNGEVKDPGRMVYGKDLKSEKAGLFDPKVFGKDGGGLRGDKWGHIQLSEPMPNPVFEKAILNLTGITGKKFNAILSGKEEVDGKTGPGAIGHMLDSINVDQKLSQLKQDVKDAPVSKLDKMNKQIRYLQNLQRLGKSPREAYMRTKIPVLPPIMRPLSVLDDGSLNTDDLNALYRGVGLVNNKLKGMDPDLRQLPEHSGKLHASMYDAMKALTGIGTVPEFHYSKRDKLQSIMNKIKGKTSPKHGFFQSKVMSRKQDMSMRSTIVPNQKIKLDEVALPKAGAVQMFKPHLVRELRGLGMTTLQAHKAIKENDRRVDVALTRVMKDTPVLLKRDPVLHKFGVMAFKPVIAEGNAIEIHPLVTGGFNADFDGDTMAAFAPATKEAKREAFKMLPSNNLFNPTYGNVMYRPGHEAQVGVFMLSELGNKTKHSFKSQAEAAKAMADGKINYSDQVKIGGRNTTMGRVMLDRALPPGMRGQIINSSKPLDKKEVGRLFTEAAHNHKDEFGDMVQQIKDLGNHTVSRSGMSLSLKDIKANKKARDQFFKPIQQKEEAIRAMKGLTKAEKEAKIVELYRRSLTKFDSLIAQDLSNRKASSHTMVRSGGLSKWSQVKQLSGAPVMFEDAKGKPVPVPVLKSYSEGLSLAEFMTAAHGARMGTLSKSQGTAQPGALSKYIVNSAMNQQIAGEDCGTGKGILMDVDNPDLVDRYLATDTKAGRRTIPAGTLITPDIKDTLRGNKKSKIHVRSPLKCAHGDGICQRCAGVSDDGSAWDRGTNIGIIAAQAMSEPTVQMSMNAFHTGGVIAPGEHTSLKREGSAFVNLKSLLNMPERISNSARLAPMSGKVTRIKKDPAGGVRVTIQQGKMSKDTWAPEVLPGIRKGKAVKSGDALSPGLVNPRELLPLAGIDAVKGSLTNQVHKAYGGNIRRRHVETVVRAMTDLAKVKDPGDSNEFMAGDVVSAARVHAFNAKLPKGKKPAQFQPILKSVEHMPLHMQEDWAARMNLSHLKNTVVEGSLQGWKSDIHGRSPVPGMMYGAEFGLSDDPGRPY